jgi:hypothetical protein
MERKRVLILLLFLLTVLASCAPGHSGSNIITFVRNGQLWTIDPDGANAFAIVTQGAPVVGYNWSPTHRLLAFRVLDTDFAKTSTAQHLSADPVTGLIADAPSTMNTVGVDGGTPITLAFSSPQVRYSNAIWNTSGARLLYRQTSLGALASPTSALWWVSQNDQPGGIAAKTLPASYSIPSISSTDMAIGNSDQGVFTTTITGTNLHYLTHSPLAGHPLPASLERVLWQPEHNQPAILYATAVSSRQASSAPNVQLILRTSDGDTRTLATCACQQFAWSPDGNYILYSAGSSYTVVNLKNNSSFNLVGEDRSVPYWSPDSQFLLLDGPHTLRLVRIATGQPEILLSDTTHPDSSPSTAGSSSSLPASNALLQPVANNIWAADSRHFLFLTHDRLLWQGHALHAGKGLYTVAINITGQPQGSPVVVDTGNDTQAGWTYEDANTSFLF